MQNFYEWRKQIIEGLKKGIFPLKSNDEFKEQARHENNRNENGLIHYNKFMKLIKSKENEMNNKLVSKYFLVQNLVTLLKKMKDLKNNLEKNKNLLNMIKSGLKNLILKKLKKGTKEIKEMSKGEREIKMPNKIVEIVEEILEFNKQN